MEGGGVKYFLQLQALVGTYHCHGLGAENLWNSERCVEGDIGEDVDHGDQDAGDGDSSGQVPHRVL